MPTLIRGSRDTVDVPWLAVIAALMLAVATPNVADATAKTKRVSVTSEEAEPDAPSRDPAVSANGGFVVFVSDAELVGKDDHAGSDIYIRDRTTGKARLIIQSTGGAVGNGSSTEPATSATGRFVTFASNADNLIPTDDGGHKDIFVRDRKEGKTKRFSVSSGGAGGDAGSFCPSISDVGRYVAFESGAENLVNGNRTPSSTCSSANAGPRGRLGSSAADLIGGVTNASRDVSVHDRKTKKVQRISVRSNGSQADPGSSSDPDMTPDARRVVFDSNVPNLVTNDDNGVQDACTRGPLL